MTLRGDLSIFNMGNDSAQTAAAMRVFLPHLCTIFKTFREPAGNLGLWAGSKGDEFVPFR